MSDTLFKKQPGYGYKCDIWSIGVILHILLTGSHPFAFVWKLQPQSRDQLYDEDSYKLDLSSFGHVSGDGKDLLEGMLAYNPETRYSIDQVLEHRYLNQEAEGHNKISAQSLSSDSAGFESLYRSNIAQFTQQMRHFKFERPLKCLTTAY